MSAETTEQDAIQESVNTEEQGIGDNTTNSDEQSRGDNTTSAPKQALGGDNTRTKTGNSSSDEEEPDDQDDGQDHPAAEAKRYRLRLRETEAERDALAARLETMQRAEVERIASREVQNPAAIWAAGTTVADVLDDQGNIDPDKVKAVTVAAAETLGLARPLTNHAPFAGQTPANRPRGGMADVIRGEQ